MVSMVNPKERKAMKTIKALCIRTAMCGGGTAYDVYWRVKDKPSMEVEVPVNIALPS